MIFGRNGKKFLEKKKHTSLKNLRSLFVKCKISQDQYTESNIYFLTFAALVASFGAKLS